MRRSKLALAAAAAYSALLLAVPGISSASDESVTVVARVYAAPGREAEAEARLLKVVDFVRKAEPGTVYQLYRSKKDPTVFMFYEVYPSDAARMQHGKVTLPAFAKEYGPAPKGLFARPIDIDIYRALVN